jgi:hypothetical protein
MILLANHECHHPSARVAACTGRRYNDGQVPSPLRKGDRKGPQPTLHHSRPYKTLLANARNTANPREGTRKGMPLLYTNALVKV